MRSTCTYLAGVILAGSLFVVAPGCDSGSGDLEKPAMTKKVDPMTDMPGFAKSQEDLKKSGKIK
jgi:hypothetical protein